MSVRTQIEPGSRSETRIRAVSAVRSGGPAALAAARVDRAGALLGAIGLASSVFVLWRLIETWRVAPGSAAHRISILGRTLSYPSANLAAVVVVALALLGLAVTVMTAAGAWRELRASRRLRQGLLASGPRPLGDVLVIDDERPRAFCVGLLRPRVYVTTGALRRLDRSALDAVLAHERHHARRRDPLRLAAGRVIARALFYVPGIERLVGRHQALAELSADESAIDAAPGGRAALARAMLSFAEDSRADDPTGIDPERIDHVLGESPNWRFPVLAGGLAAGVFGLLVALGLLAGRLASGSASLAPPFLSRQPCVVVLATIPGLVALAAREASRRARRPGVTYDETS